MFSPCIKANGIKYNNDKPVDTPTANNNAAVSQGTQYSKLPWPWREE
jgi:hypothetical protein